MSLRNFHIFFISISALLCLGIIFWGIWNFKTTGQWQGLGYSGIGAAGVAILVGYLKWFLKKYAKLMVVALTSIVSGMLAFQASPLLACGVCYKDPNDPLTYSTLIGVAFLAVVIVSVLCSISYIGFSWAKRARAMGGNF